MIIEAVAVGELGVNCYVVGVRRGSPCVIIDPGDDGKKIARAMERAGVTPGIVVNTHGHYDHIGCDDDFGVEVYVHSADLPMLGDARLNYSAFMGNPCKVRAVARPLEDGQALAFGGMEFTVIHTPGHSPGSICLLLNKPETGILFSGDTLFRGSVGRADLHGGDEHALMRSIRERLCVLPPGTVVYPGHGPATTIRAELRDNPFLGG